MVTPSSMTAKARGIVKGFKKAEKWYSKGMNLEFKEAAFRHNKSEADIRCAFLNPCYDGPIEDDSGKDNRFI